MGAPLIFLPSRLKSLLLPSKQDHSDTAVVVDDTAIAVSADEERPEDATVEETTVCHSIDELLGYPPSVTHIRFQHCFLSYFTLCCSYVWRYVVSHLSRPEANGGLRGRSAPRRPFVGNFVLLSDFWRILRRIDAQKRGLKEMNKFQQKLLNLRHIFY